MGDSRRSTLAIFACVVSLLLVALLAPSLGAVCLSLTELFYGPGEVDSPAGCTLLHVWVSHLLAVTLAEAGLSVSGALIQTVLQSPFANPGTTGVNTSAGLVVAFCMVLLSGVVPILPFAAFLGALASVLLVYGTARRVRASCITLMSSSVAPSSLMTAGINTLVTVSPDIMTGLRDFWNEGFGGASTGILRPVGLVTLFEFPVPLLFAGGLDMPGPGEITVSSLRLPAWFYRFPFLALAAALVDATVSFADPFGFMGLIVPHMACSLLKGSGRRSFLLLSALLGAAFSIPCDTAARTAFVPLELPVGVLVAYLGVPFLLWLLFWERRERHD